MNIDNKSDNEQASHFMLSDHLNHKCIADLKKELSEVNSEKVKGTKMCPW